MDDVALCVESIHKPVFECYQGNIEGVTKIGDACGLKWMNGLLFLVVVALARVSGIWL